jgi:hypothetical protein
MFYRAVSFGPSASSGQLEPDDPLNAVVVAGGAVDGFIGHAEDAKPARQLIRAASTGSEDDWHRDAFPTDSGLHVAV